MGSRLLPLTLALGALVADAAGLHGLASFVVLAAVIGAAAAAFVGIGDLLAGKGTLVGAVSSALALVLLVVGSLARGSAPAGGHVPTLALSTLVLAACAYALPLVAWLLEPLVPKPRPRLRTDP
jgi:hypothetical protein